MAKFYGEVGYRITEDQGNDVWKPRIVTRSYYGDVVTDIYRRLRNNGNINDDVDFSEVISIVSDPFAYENFLSLLYVEYMGIKWKITKAEVKSPRIILTLGEVYNG